MNKSESIGKLAEALAKAQAEMSFAKKDSANPFFGSKYADLAAVVEAIKKPLSDNGLSYVQGTDIAEDGSVIIETMLMHSSGEWTSSRLRMKPVKDDPQSVGSAVTYGRRYGLQALVGIPADDDDGEGAQGRGKDSAQGNGKPPKATHSPTDGAVEALSKDEQAEAQRIASSIVVLFNEGKEFAAYEAFYEANLSNEMKLGVWELLKPHSALRRRLKSMHDTPERKAA